MNCSEKVYHQNIFGSSKHCICNHAVHLNFGNVSLLLSFAQLRELNNYVAETLLSECEVEDVDDRCIYIPTRNEFLYFAMTYSELELLYDILHQTVMMLEIDDALNNK